MKKRYFLILIYIFFILTLTACGVAGEKGAKPSVDWSRSAQVGGDAQGSASLAMDEKNSDLFLVWSVDTDLEIYFRFIQMSKSAEIAISKDLDFPGQLRTPRLVLAKDGQLHLFWSSRTSNMRGWELWHALLDVDGDLLREPAQISIGEAGVWDFAVTSDNAAGAVVAWGPRGQGDVYITHLDPEGEMLSGPMMVATQGKSPSLRVDLGVVHLAWLSGTRFLYAEMPLDELRADEGRPAVDLTIGTGDSLTGPVVGLSDGWVYLLWSILSQSGLEAGTARTNYVAFPRGTPTLSNPSPIRVLPAEDQPYIPYQGSLALNQLVEPPQSASASTDYILHPESMMKNGSELAVALSANQDLRMNDQLQIAVSVFSEGLYKGYSFASKTEQLSDNPVLSVDSAGHIYLAWRDGIARQNIFYSTTEPDAAVQLDRLSSGDLVNAVLQGSMEGLVSVAFMPFVGFGWVLPGLIVIGIWKLFKDQENVSEPSSWLPLIISVALYYAVKLTTLPTIVTYVPFSAWLHIPPSYELPLRIGIPLMIVLIAFFVAHLVRVRYSDSAVAFYLSLTLTDAFLTLAVYGVNFLGVF